MSEDFTRGMLQNAKKKLLIYCVIWMILKEKTTPKQK